MSEPAKAIASQRRKSGAVQGLITRLRTRITDLQLRPEHTDTLPHTHKIAQKLEDHDAEFKTQHFALLKLIKDEEVLTREQELMDEHNNEIGELKVVSFPDSLFCIWVGRESGASSQHFCPSSGMQAQVLVCKFACVRI